MASLYEIQAWALGNSYSKHSVVTNNGYNYYALREIAANTSFDTINDFGGVYNLNNRNYAHFIWQPTYNYSINNQPKVKVIKFNDGWEQRIADGISNQLLELELSFTLRTDAEAFAINHFFYARNGKDAFLFTPPPPFGILKKWVVEQWNHNQIFYNNSTITARFREVVS